MPFPNNCFTFKAFYTAFCCLAVASMISYWMYKYYKDEDLCLVDYQPTQDLQDESLPVLSVCYYDPFPKHGNPNATFNATNYVQHISGNIFDETFQHVQYEKLAVNLTDSIVGFHIGWKNGTSQIFNTNEIPAMVHFSNTFNGFLYEEFINCFGIGVNEQYKRNIAFSTAFFRRDDDLDSILANPELPAFTIMHYPNQFLLVSINYKVLNMDTNRTVNSDVYYTVGGVEILKRRNKFREPCKSHENFDKFVIEKHTANDECRPPYLSATSKYPICNTKEKMKRSTIGLGIGKGKEYVKPCLSMSR